jgi:hypothetical protein
MPSNCRRDAVRLELRKDAKHVEEALAGRGARVDRLFGRLERGTLGPDSPAQCLEDHQWSAPAGRSASPLARRERVPFVAVDKAFAMAIMQGALPFLP